MVLVLSVTPDAVAVVVAAAAAAACGTLAAAGRGRLAHRRGPQDHGLLEVRAVGARAGRRRRLGYELELVLADLDHVVVLQEVLLDRVAVDDRAVGAAQILEEGIVEDGDDARRARRSPPDCRSGCRYAACGRWWCAPWSEGDLLEHQAVHAENQLCHGRSPWGSRTISHVNTAAIPRAAPGYSRTTRTSITETLSRPPLSLAICTSCCAASVQVSAERLQRHADVLVVHHVAQAVGAQQINVARPASGTRGFRARPWGRCRARVVTRFLFCECFACSGGDQARVDLLLQQRVVARDLLAARPARRRYRRESPRCATSTRLS